VLGLALTEPSLGLRSLAWPGFRLHPNPGENLAGMFLQIRSDIYCIFYPPLSGISWAFDQPASLEFPIPSVGGIEIFCYHTIEIEL